VKVIFSKPEKDTGYHGEISYLCTATTLTGRTISTGYGSTPDQAASHCRTRVEEARLRYVEKTRWEKIYAEAFSDEVK